MESQGFGYGTSGIMTKTEIKFFYKNGILAIEEVELPWGRVYTYHM